MTDEEILEPEDIGETADVDPEPAKRNPRSRDMTVTNRIKAAIKRARDRGKLFDADPEIVAEFQSAQTELEQLGCPPAKFTTGEIGHAFGLIRKILRGIQCKFPSVQQMEPEQVAVMDQKDHPRLPYMDAAIDEIISFSREYEIPKSGPTDKLISRAVSAACDFFEKQPDNLSKEYVERAQNENHLRSLGRQKHGTKKFK